MLIVFRKALEHLNNLKSGNKMTVAIIITVVCSPLLFLLWASIHEYSHLFAVKSYVRVIRSKIKLYPHRNESLGFVWASIRWHTNRRLTMRELAWVSFAPRWAGIIALVLFPLWSLMPSPEASLIWGVIWGGGLIDVFVGSLGISVNSDLRRASYGWNISPWILRISGMSAIIVSVMASILLI